MHAFNLLTVKSSSQQGSLPAGRDADQAARGSSCCLEPGPRAQSARPEVSQSSSKESPCLLINTTETAPFKRPNARLPYCEKTSS